MSYTIEQMSDEMHRIIAAEPGPEGRKKVCALVQKACADQDFVAKHLPEDGPERKILYEDPNSSSASSRMSIMAPKRARRTITARPGRSMARRFGETVMSDWDKLAPASESEPGKVELRREYTLTPGMAYVYNEGDLHSPRRAGSTRLIRIEGRDVTKIRRYAYERVS